MALDHQDANETSPQHPAKPGTENLDSAQLRQPGGWEGKVWYAPDYDEADAEIEKLINEG